MPKRLGRPRTRPKPGGWVSAGETEDLVGQADLVFVDAPCTGSGTWRRGQEAWLNRRRSERLLSFSA